MRNRYLTAMLAVLALGGVTLSATHESEASSHREAPFITKNPKVDGTDFYMFRSYEAGRTAGDGYVTLISNWQPLQDAYGGPNYFTMDSEALYEIHVDNNGDSAEDITFQFRFQNPLVNGGKGVELPIGGQNVGIPLRIAGPVNGSDPNLGAGSENNISSPETFSVKVIRGNRRTGTAQDVTNKADGATVFKKPLDNVGVKTFQGGYKAYADKFIYEVNIPGCATPGRIFVGQRAESFAVNLGTIFDLVNAPLGVITNPALRGAVANPIASKNITTTSVEIPTSCLKNGKDQIGGWSTASVRQARVINPTATYGSPSREGGSWVQVSRLGSPLVNEVVIGLADKDRFNSSEPKDDAQFAKYVTNPTLPKLVELIYGAANAPAPTAFPRTDLVAAFLTGIPGVNANGATSEMLRLNVAIGPTTGAQSDFGAASCLTASTAAAGAAVDTNLAGCDPAGFPNGRRPGDDITDIALRVVMGRLLDTTKAPAGPAPLHDAVLQTASQFDSAFPYLKTPNGGT